MSNCKKWADGPWALIETPSATKDIKEHTAYYIANEMAFAHNCMLRGLNAIHLQAPHVPSSCPDASDFLFFIASWSAWILHHHVLEEERMFPGFENVEGVEKGALGENVEQHHAFSEGMKALNDYASSTPAAEYSGKTVLEMIDRFAEALHRHLSNEISTLMKLDCVSASHAPKLLRIYKECEVEAGKQDKFVVPPMVFGLCDRTFQGGNTWPEMPWGSEYVVNWVLWRRHSGAWRFLPSDGWRVPRDLEFLGDTETQTGMKR